MTETILLDGNSLTIEQVVRVAYERTYLDLTPTAVKKVERAAQAVRLLGEPFPSWQVISHEPVVRLGQLRVVGCETMPESLLNVIIRVVITMPGGTAGRQTGE